MTRQASVSFEQNFSNGLVTQATGLNFPENACIETYNCIFKETGLVSRRPQFDFESQYITENFNRTQAAITTYNWRGASEVGDYVIIVTQIGNTLYFYDTGGGESLSKGFFSASSIDMTTFATDSNHGSQECTFATGLGYLFVFHPTQDPFYVSFDPSTSSFSANEITIQIRDLIGVDDSLKVDERPGSITDLHKYNLYNQGWGVTAGATTPFAAWDTARADFPSNADVWWDYKDETDTFDITYVANVNRGTTPAPKGHYILGLFSQQRDTISGLVINDVIYTQRPSVGAFFAGRIWYAGIGETDLNNNIYYSKIIEKTEDFGKCYQVNDPTSEELSVITAVDGGVISIPEIGTILKLEVIGNFLLIFATNGIWTITGSDGIGFTAINYVIGSLSNVPSISSTSFVNIHNAIIWWNLDGIYALSGGGGGKDSGFNVKSLTNDRIKDFYAEIPVLCKKQARGTFNALTQVVQWLYRSSVNTTVEDVYEYDSILNLNVLSGAFYPWTISQGSVKVHGLVTTDVIGQSRFNASNVVDSIGNLVIDGSSNQVVAYSYAAYVSSVTTTKYLVSYGTIPVSSTTWAEVAVFTPPYDYLDWYTYDNVGVDYESYFVSGYKLRGQGVTKFQSNYLNVFGYSQKESPIQFDVQARWDYALTNSTGKWTNKQRVNIPDSDYSFVRRRLKIRGRGVTVQFKYSSVSGQPMSIAGWSVYETSAGGV